jgi:multidrug efflux pump subunit AcrA (membrane-fusion protein)
LGVVAATFLVPWGGLGDRLLAAARPAAAGGHGGHDEHDEHDEHGDEHAGADHVDLSPTARANLGLKTGRVQLTDFVRTLHIPGEVVEAPGYSTADVPARVAGVVTAIRVSPGQAVRPGDPLFELDLTGEALAEAQSRLLDDLQQLTTTEAELARLGPLTERGSVAAKQRLQLEYDQRRIEGQRNTRIQELLIRGLTRPQIDRIITNRELVKSVTVLAPQFPEENPPPGRRAGGASPEPSSGSPGDWEYTVESIDAHPGESVTPERSLARLARHTRLYVRGHAFERDVPAIAAALPDGAVTVEFGGEGHQGGDGLTGSVEGGEGHGESVEGLHILYIDNHVDPASQTFAFYVPLKNEVLRDVLDQHGRVFRSWKFKPGQRVHVRVPVERIEKQIVLPANAVAAEGPEAYVFRLAGRHARPERGPGGARLYDEEFEQVPVVVRYRDTRQVVVAPGGALRPSDVVAMNRAYQLLLALKNASEGPAPHSHEH